LHRRIQNALDKWLTRGTAANVTITLTRCCRCTIIFTYRYVYWQSA